VIFQQVVNEEAGCLSYLIGCAQAGEAVIVDPGRDRVDEYVARARKKGLQITHILETHLHADHVSGNRDLAAKTRAPILIHHSVQAAFDHSALRDGDEIRIGTVLLKILHTPGHTPDSVSLLVTDLTRSRLPWFVLTGDTLFVGDVGRPDLGGDRAAGDLYDSISRVLLPLDDSVEVYPAHGAGSLCGRAMSFKTGSTIGFERRFNPALQAKGRAEFIAAIMAGLPPKPPSFESIVAKNRGLVPLREAKPRPLTAAEAHEEIGRGASVVDVRDPATYGEGHIPGSLNVWIESPQFGDRVGWFVPPGTLVVVVAQGPSDLERALTGLARVGVDDILGFLQWGLIDWKTAGLPLESVPQITVHDLAEWLEEGREVTIIDVREPFEWGEGHIAGALHVPMREAAERRAQIPAAPPKAVVCSGGLRSSTVISALKKAGLGNWYNVSGGMTAWQKSGYPVER
jgi:glyoxylase-like metal-dependent hydrolase (beta-lactamase superfamily II)/rhodanese-related sulfurtransferase